MNTKLSFNFCTTIIARYLYILFIAIFPLALAGQIYLDNPSFEDKPQDATTPHGWWECEPGTTPDILPGFWGVKTLPLDGQTYVGMITREDGSFESIGQQIYPPLQTDQCYEMYIHLARSRKYVGYTKDIQLNIWLSNNKCEKGQLIFTSPEISHRKWKKYPIQFNSEGEFKYILIEVFSKKEGRKGHILIDAISPIGLCSRA